jgi:hypothetical protein
MDDTRPEIAEKVCEMMQMKTPIERLKMGFSMYETSKYLVARAIQENSLIYSGAALRQELFLKFYGNDFDAATKQKILNHLGPIPSECKDLHDFQHIPEAEKGQHWWRLLFPLLQARLSRGKLENSKLLRVLSGKHTWIDIKNCIGIALKNVKNGERILSRSSEIKGSSDPDGIIDDMFGELRTIPYLSMKGFKNISYYRREGLDFKAEFEGKIYYIESTYVHGPDFKTQEYVFTPNLEEISAVYRILPDKLIQLFERTYLSKKEQILRHRHKADSTLLFMITDLEETYEPWLEHVKIQGRHPILNLVLSWDIPTVIFGCGSVYEPHSNSLGGVFGSLLPFNWQTFTRL